MRRHCFLFSALWALLPVRAAFSQAEISAHATCAAEAKRTLHREVLVWRFGDLTGEGKSACLAVVPTGGNQTKEEIHAKRGIVIQSDGKEWHELLRFDEQIKNKQGYL